jgi:signal transduction histidine kinase
VTPERLALLLVDDDAVDRMAIRRALVEGHVRANVEERDTPEAALAALHTQAFDCILLDYRLPSSTGLEFLAALRGAGINAPVVVLTGQGDEDLAVALMKAGAADYLSKNALTPERLARSLRYAMALHRSEEERAQLLLRERQAREEAQKANRAKDEFLAMLSHELRTPLNAILGWTALLKSERLGPEERKRAIGIIERNTQLQAQLIEDLLDISRITRGKLRLELQDQSLAAIVDAAVDAVRPSAAAKRIALAAHLHPGEGTVHCDAARIQQVIWNLLTNAIKFTPEGGAIEVTLARQQGHFSIVVSDSGPGIDAGFLPHVFDPFQQQDGMVTREHGGLGLGLAIVQHIVELHGGGVTATSEPGRGASFVVTLPAVVAALS